MRARAARLCLASASPRRRALLALLVQDFEVRPAAVDETPRPGELPANLAVRLARAKAAAGRAAVGGRALGGDTVVALGDRIFGKPADAAAAREMLTLLSGRAHQVFSAVAVCDAAGTRHLLSTSTVVFRPLSAAVIAQYCAGGDPCDKAGGYGLQGPAGNFVARLEGSYSGVIGLPLRHTCQLLFQPSPAPQSPL